MVANQLQERLLFGDEADAHVFWRDKEFKTFAVDVIENLGSKQKRLYTMYVSARTGEGAVICARKNDRKRKPMPRYFPRLAGPVELGCTLRTHPVNA